jgi:hypothetical protein
MRDLVILFVHVIGTFRRQDPNWGNLWVPHPWRVDRNSKPYGLVAEWFGLEI